MSERKTYNKILGRMRLVAVWVIVAVLLCIASVLMSFRELVPAKVARE